MRESRGGTIEFRENLRKDAILNGGGITVLSVARKRIDLVDEQN